MRLLQSLIHFLPQPVVAMVAIPVAVLVIERGLFDPPLEMSFGTLRWAGVAVIALGVAIEGWCAETFVRCRVTWDYFDPPSSLVTGGPYRHSRHPVYVGGLLLVFGGAILFESVGLFVYMGMYALLMDRVFIPLIEEPTLIRRFGEEYARYRSSVPRWL